MLKENGVIKSKNQLIFFWRFHCFLDLFYGAATRTKATLEIFLEIDQ